MIEFVKVWNDKKTVEGKEVSTLGSKKVYLDERTPMESIESCRMKDEKGEQMDCTKIFYPSKYVTVKGTPIEFMQKFKEAGIASMILVDLYAAGFTIKEFMRQNEQANGVEF